MRGTAFLPVVLVSFAVATGATSLDECVPTFADPSTVNVARMPPHEGSPNGRTFYLEERRVPEPLQGFPPIPGTGFVFGAGTTFYEETNQIANLQRGGGGFFADWWPPGCDQNPDWQPGDATVPCIFLHGEESVDDETCGGVPDSWTILLIPGPWHNLYDG